MDRAGAGVGAGGVSGGDGRGGLRIGYCTNVHAGTCLEEVLGNLDRHAAGVRDRLAADPATRRWTGPMDVGLWLPVETARRLRTEHPPAFLAEQLAARGLRAFTFNGFPYGDFHRRSVKHEVYRPGWDDPRRLAYTRDLVEIMAQLHGPGAEVGISTVPITWGPWCDEPAWARAVANLRLAAAHAADVEARSGVCVHLDLEPEPGCVLDRPIHLVRLFEDRLLPRLAPGEEARVRRHLRACHDACHAAVMFDGQAESMQRLQAAGIAVGKVQVSSALDIDFAPLDAAARAEALERLRGFAEPRYLHQVVIRRRHDGPVVLVEDLPQAIEAAAADPRVLEAARWRVHFHVPVHAAEAGRLGTTRDAIDACLAAAIEQGVRDFEVETYAWSVLPEEMQPADLAEGIAAELAWTCRRPAVLARVDASVEAPADAPADAAP